MSINLYINKGESIRDQVHKLILIVSARSFTHKGNSTMPHLVYNNHTSLKLHYTYLITSFNFFSAINTLSNIPKKKVDKYARKYELTLQFLDDPCQTSQLHI